MKTKAIGITLVDMNGQNRLKNRPPLRNTKELLKELDISNSKLYKVFTVCKYKNIKVPVHITSGRNGNYFNHKEFVDWYNLNKDLK